MRICFCLVLKQRNHIHVSSQVSHHHWLLCCSQMWVCECGGRKMRKGKNWSQSCLMSRHRSKNVWPVLFTAVWKWKQDMKWPFAKNNEHCVHQEEAEHLIVFEQCIIKTCHKTQNRSVKWSFSPKLNMLISRYNK